MSLSPHIAELRRLLRMAFTAALLGSLCTPVYAKTPAQKKIEARQDFEHAQRLREALTGKPEEQRTKRDYQRAIDAFRAVYYTAPASSKADESVRSVAELLAEEARTLHEPEIFQAAIGEYEFLRKEYPGSKYRVDALFTIAQIYHEDLNDQARAKDTFQQFLDRYPNSHLSEQAQQALDDIAKAERSAKKKSNKQRKADTTAGAKPTAPPSPDDIPPPATESTAADTKPAKHNRILVTSIRHWSTPDYTRVAIDVDDEVKYEAGRVPSPDRIFFDLHNAKLASELVGKSFDIGDGFLRKVRIAPYKSDTVRVVLDVDDVSDYSAFLLPNPYRLIIDIHGKHPIQTQAQVAKAVPPSTPVGKHHDIAPPPRIPAAADNDADATASDLAKLTQSSTEQKATEKPTSNPVVAKVAPRPPDRAPRTQNPMPQIGAVETTIGAAPAHTMSTPVIDDNKIDDNKIDDNMADSKTASATPSKSQAKPVDTAVAKKTEPDTDSSTGIRAKLPARGKGKRAVQQSASIRAAQPTSDGDRSLIRALGLKIGRIVVDAGHGGHDTGTIGPNGLCEKDLVLDVTLRLGKLLERNLGAEVVYTRDDDTFVPLETRTAIANKEQADLFISVHANSSPDPAARGIETYYLNFTSDPGALDVAARENAVSEKSIHELQDLVKKIALKEKIEESREFASDVESSMHDTLVTSKNVGLKDRGVKKAPFIVLIGANMPSILSEISFVSNPQDEKRLRTPEYRQKIAEALYHGVEKYVGGLSGIKIAAKTSTDIGQ